MSAREGATLDRTDAVTHAEDRPRPLGGVPARVVATAPALPFQLLAVVVVLWVVAEDAGSPLARWGAGALAITALLVAACLALPRPPRPARPVLVLLVAMVLYTAWSYATVLWAAVPGDAWIGSNRTALYVALLALLVLWPMPTAAVVTVVGLVGAGIGALAVVTLAGLSDGAPPEWFVGTRLAWPTGYPNAEAALWALGAWVWIGLASGRGVPGWLRVPGAALAVVLLALLLLAESRGALLALPLVAVAALLAAPHRVRIAAMLALIAAPLALVAPQLLDVGAAIDAGDRVTDPAVTDALGAAVRATLVAAGAVALAVAAWAAAERRRIVGPRGERRLHRGVGAVLVAGAVAVLVAAAAGVGEPRQRVESAWASFQGGYADGPASGSRLTSGLGSDRQDFYRVALDAFRAAPVRGEGVDNFRQRYLREGRGGETPRHPHSLPLRVLSQTGLVGALLFGVALAAAGVGAWRGARRGGPAAAAAVTGAALAALSWLVHGSADWLFEIGGLGALAFALVGVACAPRAAGEPARPPGAGLRSLAAAVVALLAAGLVLGAPWLADRYVARAGEVFPSSPATAIANLDRAARLDPLSSTAPAVEGTARLRLGDLAGAREAFAEASRRVPDDQYALLMRGAIASAEGRRAEALALLGRSVAVAPRDPVARAALDAARGRGVDLLALQRVLLARGD